MISQGSRPEAARTLIRQLDPKRPEAVIAVLKLVSQDEFRAVRGKDLTPFIQSKNPVVRGFAMACHYHRDAAADRPVVRKWLHSDDQDFRQSGIICAGLSREPEYIQQLLAILDEDNIAPLIPDIIIALSRLKAKELNHILFSYLSHDLKPVRLAALDALEINSDMSLQRAIHLLADSSDTIREFAKEKFSKAIPEQQAFSPIIGAAQLPGSERPFLISLKPSISRSLTSLSLPRPRSKNATTAWPCTKTLRALAIRLQS